MERLPLGSLSSSDLSAVAASSLRDLPRPILEELLFGATRLAVPALSMVHREGEDQPHVEMVLSGLVRAHVTAADGRTLTVRYCRPGALVGIATLYAPGFVRPFGIQALADSELLALRAGLVREWADRDIRVATALLHELSDRVLGFVGELADSAFASVRARIGRHLLDLASARQEGAELVAPISQQELADACGTVREVVVRVLRDLRAEGVVETKRNGIVIRDPDRLLWPD